MLQVQIVVLLLFLLSCAVSVQSFTTAAVAIAIAPPPTTTSTASTTSIATSIATTTTMMRCHPQRLSKYYYKYSYHLAATTFHATPRSSHSHTRTSTSISTCTTDIGNNHNHYYKYHNHKKESRIRHFASSSSSSSNHDDTDINNSISSSSSPSSPLLLLTKAEKEERIQTLNKMLHELDINGDEIRDALHRSLTTMEGFDVRYGKSAIKTYKTFIDPKPSKIEQIRSQDVLVAASRCARQIDFLIKRHKSHVTEWVRHTDIRNDSDGNGDRDGNANANGHYNDDGSIASSNEQMRIQKKRFFPIIILLDNVRSAFNVGSIFRTADACNCASIYTTGITPSPHGRGREKLAKSALGADLEVPSKHFSTTKDAIHYIRNERNNMEGWSIVGMETTDQSRCYTDVEYPGKGLYVVQEEEGRNNDESISLISKEGVVLVLGNEVTGVDTEIMPLLDLIVEIPMFGTKNSLNIAACAPVVLYEILRQWDAVNDESLR